MNPGPGFVLGPMHGTIWSVAARCDTMPNVRFGNNTCGCLGRNRKENRHVSSRLGKLVGACGLVIVMVSGISAQDWPQWRGVNRDAKVRGSQTPATWPEELKKVWTVTVGDGVATPSLQGDRFYVFSRQGDEEVTRCLNAETGEVLWTDKYATAAVQGPDGGFGGPRSSPTVAEGKVVTLGVNGVLSCLDASTGDVAWRNDEYDGEVPRFHTSSSPIVVDGTCVAQLGGEDNGVIAAFDLSTGQEKWSWEGEGSAYASPVLLRVGDVDVILAETNQSIVGLRASDGKLLWQMPYVVTGRGYNAATPIIAGQTIIYTGSNRGAKAAELASDGAALTAKDLWSNEDNSVQYNSPVLKDGFVYGLSNRDVLFCINAATGETVWTAPMGVEPQPSDQPPGERRGRRGRGGGGYGSIVDADTVLFVLTPLATLTVFEPNSRRV